MRRKSADGIEAEDRSVVSSVDIQRVDDGLGLVAAGSASDFEIGDDRG